MDYEKKYKEVLVNMQELYNSMKYMASIDALRTTTALERAFPELKERQGEQKSIWTEDDERLCNASIRACKYVIDNFENSTLVFVNAINWLKSLKDRFQPHWKPSAKQLNSIKYFVEAHELQSQAANGTRWGVYDTFKSLYNDLKKL